MDPTRLDLIARRLGRARTRRGLLRAVVGVVASRAAAEGSRPAAAQVCTFDGGFCPVGCGWGQSCPGCCGGRCGSGGVCASGFAGCTGSGCSCTVGQLFACGVGLACCSTTGTAFSAGTCQFFCPYA